MAKIRTAEHQAVSSGRIVAGGIVGILLTLVLTFGAAIALTREILPLAACRWLGPVIIGLSAFFSAWSASCKNGKKLMCGLLAAVLYVSVLMLAGLFMFSAPMKPLRLVLSVAAALLGGLGGVFSAGLTE